MWILKEMGGAGLRGCEQCWMGVDKGELSSRYQNIQRPYSEKWDYKLINIESTITIPLFLKKNAEYTIL